ncbi:MAG: nucleoside-diphosphate sugar epimerase [Rhodospirillaceae bacterium]|nr:MAG: nucleoside-diphosphate sugar epimerase [Rhodospirillaceae bacterium]
MTASAIWVLTDDRPGTATQALAVAERLGRPFIEKRLRYDGLAKLPNALRGASLLGIDDASREALIPPWPDLVIGAGRRCAPVARWIKHQGAQVAGHPVILVQVMHPGRAGAADFDLIALPRHDCTTPGGDAANVLRVTGAPNRITADGLVQARAKWEPVLAGLQRPRIALLVGGATNRRPFPTATAADLGRRVAAMARAAGGSIMLATSRRTGKPAEAALTETVPEPRSVFFWGQGGENPYLGFLAFADAVVVTGDSVSMCSEACATGKPVFIAAPVDITAPKHRRLHQELYAAGYARPLDGTYATWTYAPLNAAAEIAAAVRRLLAP